MEQVVGPSKTSIIPHDIHNCPLVARVQALQTQLAYYKAMCIAYETGKLKAQGNNRRLAIQKINSKQMQKMKLGVPEANVLQGFKEDQIKFSQQIQKKIKKGVKKSDDNQQSSFSKTPAIHGIQNDFSEKNQTFFLDEVPTISQIEINTQQYKSKQNSLFIPRDIQQNQVDRSSQQPEIISEVIPEIHQQQIISQVNVPPQLNNNTQKQAQIITKPSMSLIADLCLFGCNEKQLKNVSIQKMNQVNPSTLFSMFNLNNKTYYDQVAKYLFPNGLFSRTIRHDRILSEVNQILLQNIKKHSNFIYQLKSELKMQDIAKQQRQLLEWLNPSLKLYCVSIVISDFNIVDPDPIYSDKQKSSEQQKSLEELHLQTNRTDIYVQKHKKRKQSKQIKDYNIYRNKKILSIFTFYPFFEFFESMLISIFNALKVQKLGLYQNKIQTIFQIESGYLLHQLQNTYTPMMKQINTTLMVPALDYQFVLGVDLLKISTDGMKLLDACLGAWIYPVLKTFDKASFYQVFTSILFQQQVIFVCDNPHMLSYTIYLFTQVLIRPFLYEHSAIYMVSYWDLLDAPTPIVLGINKPSQWLEQTQLRDTHLYVHIGQQITLIDKRKEQKKVKSDKLRKIISNFFKSIDRDSITFFKQKKKKDNVEYNLASTRAQKQLSMLFVSSINVFMKQELSDYIPSQQFIDHIQERFRWSNIAKNQDAATIISEDIIKQMLRVRKDKDPFVEKFMRTQIFLTYLFNKVKIQQ